MSRYSSFRCAAQAEVPGLLPAEEVAVVDATPVAKPRPKPRDEDENDRPRGRRRDESGEERPLQKRRDDDDDDYEFDHPRRARRRRSGPGAGVVVALVLGGLVLLAGIGFGVYYLAAKVNKTAPPPGWKEFTYKDDNFKAYFPKEPHVFGGRDLAGVGGGR